MGVVVGGGVVAHLGLRVMEFWMVELEHLVVLGLRVIL